MAFQEEEKSETTETLDTIRSGLLPIAISEFGDVFDSP